MKSMWRVMERPIAGKTFYQVSYPMRTHGISEGPGTSRHVRTTLIDFFNKNL